MKIFITTIFSFILFLSASALPADDIKIRSNAKASCLEVKYNCARKKGFNAAVTIMDDKGNTLKNFNTLINKGENFIALANDFHLKEGMYKITVARKKKTLSTRLLIFE